MSLQECVRKTGLAVLLMSLVGICASCQVVPTHTAEPSPMASVAPSEQMRPTPAVTPTTNTPSTGLPEATPSESPSATITPHPSPAMPTETPTPVDMGEIIYFEPCGDIWRVDPADGGTKDLLYTDDLCKDGPELSPNERWAAYDATEAGQAQPISLWLLDIDRKEAWQVSAEAPAYDYFWMPDNRLLYTEYPSFVFDPYGDEPPDYGTDFATFIYDPATKTRTQVPLFHFGLYVALEVCPAEERIVVVTNKEWDMLLMDLDGSEARILIKRYPMNRFAWSPNCKQLAFARGLGLYRPGIYVMDVDSGHIIQLAQKDDEQSIIVRSWSPDGKWIAFDQDGQLCVVHVESGEEKCFDVSPPGQMGYPITWSPDSSTIVDTHSGPGEDQSDLYLIRVADGTITRLTYDDNSEYFLLWRR